jgi:4-amino-4-deoxy-L-arabinose transferase-like glycosyltransferase
MIRALIVALALLHIALAFLYASRTPYREAGVLLNQGRAMAPDIGAPDERQHVNMIARLATGKGFAVLGDKNEDPYENYQAHQPPLYYVLGAAWSKLGPADQFTAPGSGVWLRLLNSLIGAAAVVGVFFLALWASKSESIALAAMAFAALLPMNVALSGAISNDPLLFALCTWATALMVRAIEREWPVKDAVLIGVLMGLASLTKTTAIALIPVLLTALYGSRAASPKSLLRVGATAIVLAVLLPLPWWLRNQSLYGDPLALKAFNEAFAGSPQAAMFINELGAATYWKDWVGWWTARSFIGVFGYMDIFLPNETYTALLVLLGLAMTAGIVWLAKHPSQPNARMRWPIWVLVGVIIVLFLRFNAQFFQGQARYLFPAIGGFGLMAGAAAGWLKPKFLGAAILALGLIALNVQILQNLPAEFSRRVMTVTGN